MAGKGHYVPNAVAPVSVFTRGRNTAVKYAQNPKIYVQNIIISSERVGGAKMVSLLKSRTCSPLLENWNVPNQ
jgi:hypothetical protein